MFLITNGSNLQAICGSAKYVRNYFIAREAAYSRQYQQSYRTGYWAKQFPTVESFVAAQLRNLKVLKIEVEGIVDVGDYQVMRSLYNSEQYDVTSQFFTLDKEETKVGEHITAQVVKKGLKSYGKTVIVNDRVKGGNTVAPTPEKFKELYDKMVRINCTVEGWGNITVAPDSLDQYKMTPIMKQTFTVKFVE